MAVVVVSILLALYIEVSTDIGNNFISFCFASEDICVFSTFYSECLVCDHNTVFNGNNYLDR